MLQIEFVRGAELNVERPRCVFNPGCLERSSCCCGSNRKLGPDVTVATRFVDTATAGTNMHVLGCTPQFLVRRLDEAKLKKRQRAYENGFR